MRCVLGHLEARGRGVNRHGWTCAVLGSLAESEGFGNGEGSLDIGILDREG